MVSRKCDVSCETEAKRRGGKVSCVWYILYVVVKIVNLRFRTCINLVPRNGLTIRTSSAVMCGDARCML